MSNNAMSNETDLDWLARNVHFWDESAYAAMCGGVERVMWVSGSAYGQMPEFKSAVTREQWLARRAELQNKPRWKDAPSWASHLAQSDSGTWHWMDGEPEINEIHDSGEFWNAPGYSAITDQCGEVLGDWRDTLERRPSIIVSGCSVSTTGYVGFVAGHQDLSEPAVTTRLKEATDNVLPAAPELMSDKFKFDPFASIEDNQEQGMIQKADQKQDNSWFERGELPPVGVECEIHHNLWDGNIFHAVKIAAITGEYLIAKYSSMEQHFHLKDMSFRPLRTEREKAIDEMLIDISERWSNCEELAKHLVDNGWVKESK